jgi:hypothetical protein
MRTIKELMIDYDISYEEALASFIEMADEAKDLAKYVEYQDDSK